MSFNLHQLDLLDLISERYLKLRKISEAQWNRHHELPISKSEWFILLRIYQEKETTVSFISKSVDITRQATHKFIKQLQEKGLVEVGEQENNRKEKRIQLTAFGKECYEKNEQLQANLEKEIAEHIGQKRLEQLKDILKMNWGIED
ncbi:MarR family winged helix-turn-helix transcriptional regulator [Allobacillus sp. GCM10007491]|uniref:Winged helix DNA-binding protein n=1 Tax=Allobacillus saliphilus TaxID=2912308 RepID=A0A941CVY4_9BACI|nr:winged helix DNA-binding protein [Allobacillus saliphilus]